MLSASPSCRPHRGVWRLDNDSAGDLLAISVFLSDANAVTVSVTFAVFAAVPIPVPIPVAFTAAATVTPGGVFAAIPPDGATRPVTAAATFAAGPATAAAGIASATPGDTAAAGIASATPGDTAAASAFPSVDTAAVKATAAGACAAGPACIPTATPSGTVLFAGRCCSLAGLAGACLNLPTRMMPVRA
jgi:hypothetical protein